MTDNTPSVISISGKMTNDKSSALNVSVNVTDDTPSVINISESMTNDKEKVLNVSKDVTEETSNVIRISGKMTNGTSNALARRCDWRHVKRYNTNRKRNGWQVIR